MTTTMEVDPFAAAVEAAKAEVTGEPVTDLSEDPTQEPGTEVLADEDEPVEQEDDQANVEGPLEDGSVEDASIDEVFADIEIEEPEPSVEDQTFQLPGIDEPISLDQLKDGYLRQADYTRKTQELAAQRKEQERAISFWEAFTQHPKQVVVQLAKEAGLDVGDNPVEKMVDMPFMSEEDLQARIDSEVEKHLADHPDIKAAQAQQASQWVTQEFSRIEQLLSITLGPESRTKVATRAYKAGTDDLEMVTRAMLAEAKERQARTQALKDSAPKRPTGAPSEITDENVQLAKDPFDNAVEHAKLELSKPRRR